MDINIYNMISIQGKFLSTIFYNNYSKRDNLEVFIVIRVNRKFVNIPFRTDIEIKHERLLQYYNFL